MGETLDFLIWLLVAVLLLLALAAAVITVRRILLERGGGTIECGLRWLSAGAGPTPGGASRGGTGPSGSAWRPGVAAYHRDELFWFGALGIALRPTLRLPRRSLTVVSRRLPSSAEAAVLGTGRVVVEMRTCAASGAEAGADADSDAGADTDSDVGADAGSDAGSGPDFGPDSGPPGTIELAMTPGALTGFLAWLEASPPSSHLRDIA